jgi:hypothetical protein
MSRGKFKVMRVVGKRLSGSQSSIEEHGHQRAEKNRVTIHDRAYPWAPRNCFIDEGPEFPRAPDCPSHSHAPTDIENLGFFHR